MDRASIMSRQGRPEAAGPQDGSGERRGHGRGSRLLAFFLSSVLIFGLGYVAWQLIGTTMVSQHRQHEMISALPDRWADRKGDATEDVVEHGEVFAVLRVPRLGHSWEVPVVRGVEDDVLDSGVGHFPETERPGQIGNFAVAGHRVTRGQPFAGFPSLREGDLVEVETRTHVYTYMLDDDGTDHSVHYSATWILDQVPGKPRKRPSRALITLMTCTELVATDQRSYVVGHLIETRRA